VLNDTLAPMGWWLEPSEAQQFLVGLRRCPHHPILATRHLRLRKISRPDVEYLETALQSAALFEPQLLPVRAQAEIGVQSLPKGPMNDASLQWAVCQLETGALVGYICLQDIDLDHSQAELRFWLAPGPNWSLHAVEAGQVTLAYAFSSLSLVSLYAFSTRGHQSTHDALLGIGLRPLQHASKARESWDRCPEVQIWNVTRHRWMRCLNT